MTTNNKRLNYNVPVELVPSIRMLADMDGVTPAYWLRKNLEQVVKERFLERKENAV
ncbi:MAG: hypothetical protein KME30_26950 [Iphinoe sp. HA4291-MV1]|nr:hypothetical protein [Iphinoe sp. HA4291-MV1]